MKIVNKAIIASAITAIVGSVAIIDISVAEQGNGHWKKQQHSGQNGHHRGGGSHKRGRRGLDSARLLENYDTNGDGVITVEEIETSRQERFDRFDTDKDGMLNLQEYEALWMNAMSDKVAKRFAKIDGDGNAAVSSEEFSARSDKMISRLDQNNDGQITSDEMNKRHRRGNHKDREQQ